MSRTLMLAAAAALFVSLSAPALADCANDATGCSNRGEERERQSSFGAGERPEPEQPEQPEQPT
jgi:hypothetical protein